MRRFDGAGKFPELVAGQVTPVPVIESVGWWQLRSTRSSREACEERYFGDFAGVEVSETGRGFSHHSVQVSLIYVAVGPVYAVLRRAMFRHHVGAPEPERLGRFGAVYARLLDDRLVLKHPQKLKINNGL